MAGTNHRWRLVSSAVAVLAVATLTSALGGVAHAKSPVHFYSVRPTFDANTQAGGHSNLTIEYRIGNHVPEPDPPECLCNDPKVLTQTLPAGFIGNPHATPRCTTAGLAQAQCPVDSQVGMVSL